MDVSPNQHRVGRPGAIVLTKGLTPEKAHPDDAAYDLIACISEPYVIEFGYRELIPTGVFAAIPEGHVGLICSRSGFALRRGLFVLNAPGVIDPSYRGEIGVILMNLGDCPATIAPGDRIAQLLILPTSSALFLDDPARFDAMNTARGEGGFGSTGTN